MMVTEAAGRKSFSSSQNTGDFIVVRNLKGVNASWSNSHRFNDNHFLDLGGS